MCEAKLKRPKRVEADGVGSLEWAENREKSVTLNSEMDFYLQNGRNGDFVTKWSYKIQFYSLSGTIIYVNISKLGTHII